MSLTMTKQEIMDVFRMSREQYEEEYMKPAFDLMLEKKGGAVATAMLGYSNICKNQCLYCGMRAGNHLPKRYRFTAEEILGLVRQSYEAGMRRLFLISGEDPKYPFENLLQVIDQAKAMGFSRISLGAGEFSLEQFKELKAAGLDEYVMKFEMSHKDTFERLNPSTTFEKRNQGLEWIKAAGLDLGSGNIIDYPGQTLDELADDILLMKELDITWAPNIPFMPAAGTPLSVGEDGKPSRPGSIDVLHREISLTRLLLPNTDITAQQPGTDLTKGLSHPEGNKMAIHAGANVLFVDMLPAAMAGAFNVIDNRMVKGLDYAKEIAEYAGVKLLME